MKTLPFVVLLLVVGLSPLAAGEAPPPPDWAGFFTADEYAEFIRLVMAYFNERGVPAALGEAVVRATSAAGEEEQEFGLSNLSQVCHQSEREEWPEIIAEHFGLLEQAQREDEELTTRWDDYEAIAGQLAVRLWHPDYREAAGDDMIVFREDLPGAASVLVYDLPHSIKQVHPDQAAAWGRDPAELFARGLENVRDHLSAPELVTVDVGKGINLLMLSGESHYVTTHALLLADHPELVGRHGALIAVPHRHALIAFPIEDFRAVLALNVLLPGADSLYREGPGSITPNVYWYHDGSFTLLPCEIGESIAFMPPAEFVEMLNQLPPAPTAEPSPAPTPAPPED